MGLSAIVRDSVGETMMVSECYHRLIDSIELVEVMALHSDNVYLLRLGSTLFGQKLSLLSFENS